MMTNERIAELRKLYSRVVSPYRHHHPVGSIEHATLDVNDCLDAIEALTARNTELVKRGRELADATESLCAGECPKNRAETLAIAFLREVRG